MSHTQHELAEVFPEFKDKIHALKAKDAHFAKLVKRHHKNNRKIHRFETGVKSTSDFHLEDLKKKRLYLLDIIQHILTHSD
ncbi:MAG TPA: DUF465 domain-containing protein [Hellea balneolensis]|uniref:DUF465 domain-containing protein n=1 Tax=Hellea balneolensis TaxID=287478 RepID=A0A7C5QZK5_9PROT|nr:DUF465 domain-containing protein [Hellea balneolensis]